MKRFSIVLVLLLVVAACGFSAWFALREVRIEGLAPDEPTAAATDDTSGEPSDASDAADSGGRKRVARIDEDGQPLVGADAVVGRISYDGAGVRGATVEAFGAPGGDYDPRLEQARQFFGDTFSEDELTKLRDRFGGMRRRGDVRSTEDSGGGSVSISVGGGGGGESSGTSGIDLGNLDLESDGMQNAMGAGMEFVGRIMSDPSMLEKAMELGKLEVAGFESDGKWPRVGSTKTEADGSFTLAGLPAGKVELRVRASGYVRSKRIVEVGHGGIEIALSRGALLEGTVSSGGHPVAGATIRSKTRTIESDGAGRFRLDGAVTPKESLLVSARGFVTAGQAVPMSEGEASTSVTVELQPAAIVRGSVVDSAGMPLAGATVRVTKGGSSFNPMMFMQLAQVDAVSAPSPSTVADENGLFELDGIPGGTVKLAADKAGYLTFTTESISVTAGETTEGIELKLLRESVVSGKVVGPGGGAVEGATVKVELDAAGGMGAMVAGMFGGSWASARTEEDGTYAVGGLTAGERKVRVESGSYLHEEVTLQVPDEDAVAHDFSLRPGYTLEGLVLTPAGEPAAAASIQVRWAAAGGGNPLAAMTGMMRGADANGTTDAEGQFKLEGLQEGPYTVTAKAEGYLDGEVEDIAQGATDVVLQLRASATVRGTVIDPDGNPVGGAWVHRKGGKRRGGMNPMMAMFAGDPRVLTAADGTFELPELEAGRYQLYARRKGYAESETLKLQVSEGETAADLQLVLRPGESLSGRVIEKGTGNALEGALVYVVEGNSPLAGFNPQEILDREPSAPANSISATTDSAGAFTLAGLSPGRVTVEVRTRDHAPASLGRVEVPGADVTVEVGMGGRVEGVVLDATGNAIAGTQVIVSGGAMGFGRQRMATSDAAGFYELDRVVPGTYQIMKMDSSSAFGVGGMSSVVVREGETTRHDFKPDASGASITGSVQRDGVPVEGAMVILAGGNVGMRMTSSETDGSFSFDGLAPGSYTVSVQTEIMGGGTTRESVKVAEGQKVSGVALKMSSLSLEGRIVDAETGAGIPMVQVILLDSSAGTLTSIEEIMRNQRGQAFTDEKGHFVITGIEDGTFTLRVSAGGYADETRQGVKPGANLTIQLDPGAEFEVTVMGPDGAPVAGATVVAQDSSGNETMAFGMGGLQAVTDGQGVATLRLSPGRFTIVAESAGFPAGSAQIDAARGSVVIRLEGGGGLEVVVKKAGQPYVGAAVALLDEAGNPIVKRLSMGNFLGSGMTTDSAGRVVREGLPPGRVTVVVTPPGGEPVRKTVTVTRGGTEKVEIELP